MKKKEKSIFRTILTAMLMVLGIEILLLVAALSISHVSSQLDQNAVDILKKQVDNRSSYLESILSSDQNLSNLSERINEVTEELIDSGEIDIQNIGTNKEDYLPLMKCINESMISTMRRRAVTGIFVAFNTEDLDVIRAAGDKLLTLAPNIRVINDNNTQDYLISGEVAAAFLYTSQVSTALQARPDLEVVYPKEGLGFGIMAGFVPAKAPNADAAYAFLDYINQPENAAKCFEYIGYYCTNKAAEEYISEDMKKMIVLPEDAAEGEIVQNISQEAEDLHAEIWNQFKSACN